MSKNIVQDIIPPSRRSIRNISISNRKSGEKAEGIKSALPNDTTSSEESYYKTPESSFGENRIPFRNRKSENSKVKFWIFSILFLVFIIIFVSSVFSGARVNVVPRQDNMSISSIFTAKKNPATQELKFETIDLKKTEGLTVPATQEESVERRASGTIVIYNNYSSESQRLIVNTRFETPEGLIYKIDESVVVPGKSIQNGEEVPGSIEAIVYADAPGESYNIGLKDFTIPGFKTDPQRFEAFSAKSKTRMTGGFVGKVKKVDSEVLSSSRASLEKSLRESLITEVKTKVPEGYILYEDAIVTSFNDLPQSEQKTDSVKINLEGVASAIIFNEHELGNYIAKDVVADEKQKIEPVGLENLQFSLQAKSGLSPENISSVSFNLSGELDLIWLFDEGKLKDDLKKLPKKELELVLSNYSSIDKAEAVIRPFWKRSFPSSVNRIKINRII